MRHMPEEAAVQRCQSFAYAHLQQNASVKHVQSTCAAGAGHGIAAADRGLRPVVRRVEYPRPAGGADEHEGQQGCQATR